MYDFSNFGPFLLIPSKARLLLIFTQISYLVHAKHILTLTQKNSGGGVSAKAIGCSGSKKNLDHFRGL